MEDRPIEAIDQETTAIGLCDLLKLKAADGAMKKTIDAACCEKYRSSQYLAPMIGARARSATVRITPRSLQA